MTGIDPLLAPYRQLVAQTDLLCARIVQKFAPQIVCRAGCGGCCQLQSVLPVEAYSLFVAWRQLPASEREALLQTIADADAEACPLLADARCPLYPARPLICRTHGLPILFATEAGRSVDFCPLNFVGVSSLPGTAVIDLDRLNLLLAQINRDFVARLFGDQPPPERLALGEIFTFPWPASSL